MPRDRLPLRPADQYRELEIDLELGDRVLDLGLPERTVLLESGKTIGWDLLCIAMGSDARRLDTLEDAVYLRELPAAELVRAKIDRRESLDIVGAGFIAGDVTRFFHPLYETSIRVEHFQTAERQGFAVGRAMAGETDPYREVPWFWSDQYDLNLQYVGAGLPWEEIVVRGELGRPPFTAFYLSAGRLVAAAGINDHHTVARARRVMEAGKDISPRQLADPKVDLRRLLA